MHASEKASIHELAKNDPKKEAHLLFASCALTKCSVEFAVGSVEYIETKKIEDLGNSAAFNADRGLLASQVGARGMRLFAYDSVNYLGGDVGIDAAKRWNNTIGFTTRLASGARALGGLATTGAAAALGCVGADTWLQKNVPGYDPRWIFLDAGPSKELEQYLSSKGIIYIIHH